MVAWGAKAACSDELRANAWNVNRDSLSTIFNIALWTSVDYETQCLIYPLMLNAADTVIKYSSNGAWKCDQNKQISQSGVSDIYSRLGFCCNINSASADMLVIWEIDI